MRIAKINTIAGTRITDKSVYCHASSIKSVFGGPDPGMLSGNIGIHDHITGHGSAPSKPKFEIASHHYSLNQLEKIAEAVGTTQATNINRSSHISDIGYDQGNHTGRHALSGTQPERNRKRKIAMKRTIDGQEHSFYFNVAHQHGIGYVAHIASADRLHAGSLRQEVEVKASRNLGYSVQNADTNFTIGFVVCAQTGNVTNYPKRRLD